MKMYFKKIINSDGHIEHKDILDLIKNDKVKMEGNITGNTLKLTVTNLKDKSFEEFVFKYQK